MEYSIKPEEHELREARQKVQEVIESYDYTLELENVEVNLGWQKLEKSIGMFTDRESVMIVFDQEKEVEDLEKNILRGLLEIEFFQKAKFEEPEFNWQEVLKFTYVKTKLGNLIEVEEPQLEAEWPDLKSELSNELEDFSEEFYINAAALGYYIGKKLLENHKLEEFPELERSDVVEAGEEVFQ